MADRESKSGRSKAESALGPGRAHHWPGDKLFGGCRRPTLDDVGPVEGRRSGKEMAAGLRGGRTTSGEQVIAGGLGRDDGKVCVRRRAEAGGIPACRGRLTLDNSAASRRHKIRCSSHGLEMFFAACSVQLRRQVRKVSAHGRSALCDLAGSLAAAESPTKGGGFRFPISCRRRRLPRGLLGARPLRRLLKGRGSLCWGIRSCCVRDGAC